MTESDVKNPLENVSDKWLSYLKKEVDNEIQRRKNENGTSD